MAKISPFKFLQEVRAETDKVTWPSRRETLITTGMVFVMVAIASVFFLLVDQVALFVVTLVLESPVYLGNLNPILILAGGGGVALLAFFAWTFSKMRHGR